MLGREVWVTHLSESTRIYPNLSVLAIGHSGCGKDTVINFGNRYIHDMGKGDLQIGGRTIEGMYQQLILRGDPAIGYLPIGELTSVVGTKDYQGGIVQGLTDLMSGNAVVNVSTKSDPKAVIRNPTLTVHAGSTIDWLHKAMPDGSLEGGFIGRFLLAIRAPDERINFHPMPAYEQSDIEQRQKLRDYCKIAYAMTHRMIAGSRHRQNILVLEDAYEYYANWYHNRFGYFSKAVMPYANRCRDTVLKIALISAMSRHHWAWIDRADIQLGITLLHDIASKIDRVVLLPTREAQCGEAIKAVLPASRSAIIAAVKSRYYWREIESALHLLEDSHEVIRKGEQFVRTAQ